jgi:hypothetical protein
MERDARQGIDNLIRKSREQGGQAWPLMQLQLQPPTSGRLRLERGEAWIVELNDVAY